MEFKEIKELDAKNYMTVFARQNICFTHGKGSKLYDVAGNEYIDMGGGIAVNCLGHDDPELTQAICEGSTDATTPGTTDPGTVDPGPGMGVDPGTTNPDPGTTDPEQPSDPGVSNPDPGVQPPDGGGTMQEPPPETDPPPEPELPPEPALPEE